MSDLDDFFAKKDRKKSKTTKKFVTADELVKKLEDTSTTKKTEIKPRKERPVNVADVEETNNLEQINEDEWKDFAEEEKKDYSGLKLGQLQINEDEFGNMGTDGEGDGGDGASDDETDPNRTGGPWKKVQDAAAQQQKEAKPVVVAQPEKPPTSNVYVSPALRLQQQQQSQQKLRKGVLPDINNQEYFPILGSAKPEEVKKKKPDPTFEEVKHGGRMQKSTDLSTNAPVEIGNRFTSLDDS